jgi:hypothetical protein
MRIWASEKESVRVEEIKKFSGDIVGHGKKNCYGIQHSEKQNSVREYS